MKLLLPVLAAVIACALMLHSFADATASDTFRCPNGAVVSVNGRLSAVARKCDAPTSMARRSVTRGFPPYGYYEVVEIEEWTYNLGPSVFVYCLTFEDGVLVRIESGDYGD